VNERTADYLGLRNDHPLRFGIAVGAAWDSHIPLLHPDDHEETRRVWSICLRTGSAGEVTFRVRNAEGEYRWFLSRAEPLRASDGTLLYWIGVNLDIEERKLAEEGLRQSEERFRLVLESLAAQVIATTLEGELEFVNQPVLDYFGKTIEQLNGWRTSGDVLHPDDLASAIAVWRDSIEKGVSYDVDHRFRHFDGVYRWFHVCGRPQRDAQGSIIRDEGLVIDRDASMATDSGVALEIIVLKETSMASRAKIGGNTGSRQPAADVEEQDRLLQSKREQEIRLRAYEIYLERGAQSGHELEDWLQAERELTK
jgi:PAS domain S-box-containing protein